MIEAFQIEERILNKSKNPRTKPLILGSIGSAVGNAVGGALNAVGAGVDGILGTNISGQNTGPDDVSLGRITAEDLGFDQSVLDSASARRGNMMEQMLARRGGISNRERQAFADARTQQQMALQGMGRGMGLADRIGAMAGRDQSFYRGLEEQSRGLGAETRGLQNQMGQYRGRLDQLMQEAQTDPTGIRDALTAQRKESIQRDAQGQKMAMERTLASRGVDPTSLKALTAIGGVDANVMQQNRMAQQSAGFDAQQMQQQRLNQRANLLQSGMNAVGQEQNFINARQNLLNNLRAGRAQEFGMDQSALGASMQGQFAGAGQYANLANANRQFGMANTQMGIGLDQAGVQDAVFDINRMDQKLLSAEQINAGLAGQEATANAQAQAGHASAQAQKQSGVMGAIGTAGTVKLMMMCIPEGTFIDVDEGYAVNIRDVQVGQMVVGYNGERVRVMQKHEYLEDPTQNRFLHITFDDGAEVDLCDMHKVGGVRSGDLKIGDTVGERKVIDIIKFADVHTSYDLLTEDLGYQINGVPVNSMIEELSELMVELKKVA